MSDIDLAATHRVALQIAHAAGERAHAAYLERVHLEFKGKKQDDPVTAVDRDLETFLRTEIRRHFPDHGLLGEEQADDIAADARCIWVLDPLDGTANFANGLPLWGVSMGLLQDGEPVLGCIWVPVGPDLRPGVFHAYRGGGAFYGDERLHVPSLPDERGRVMALPGGHLRAFHFARPARGAPRPQRFLPDSRTLGSCTAEQVLVATGALRGTIFLGPSIWDVAAGATIVREAGAVFLVWRDHAWRPFDHFSPQAPMRGNDPPALRHWHEAILAAAPEVAERVTARLRWHPRPPRRLARLLGLLASR